MVVQGHATDGHGALVPSLPTRLERPLLKVTATARLVMEGTLVVLLAAIVVVVFLQVLTRYVLNASLSWTEELARFLQVWLVLLASGPCARRGMHVAVDFFTALMPSLAQRLLAVAMHALLVLYAMVIIRYSPDLLEVTLHQAAPALGWSMALPYAALPIGMLFLVLEEVGVIYGILRGRRSVVHTDDGRLEVAD